MGSKPILTTTTKKVWHDCLSVNCKGIYFDVFVFKEPNYSTMIKYTYSGIAVRESQKESYQISIGKVYKLQNLEPFACCHLCIGALYNHNGVFNDGITKHQVYLENVLDNSQVVNHINRLI